MLQRIRDDVPTAFNLDRRELIIGGLAVGAFAAVACRSAFAVPASWSEADAAQFMEISALLIPHHINEEVGKRIGAAMSAINPMLSAQIASLLSIAKKKNARVVEDFFADVPEGSLKELALAIISAWYLGVVSAAPDAEVLAFEYALMYKPTRDVMTIPSYAISRPNGWSAIAPPLSKMPVF